MLIIKNRPKTNLVIVALISWMVTTQSFANITGNVGVTATVVGALSYSLIPTTIAIGKIGKGEAKIITDSVTITGDDNYHIDFGINDLSSGVTSAYSFNLSDGATHTLPVTAQLNGSDVWSNSDHPLVSGSKSLKITLVATADPLQATGDYTGTFDIVAAYH